jgi:hypothetical protein
MILPPYKAALSRTRLEVWGSQHWLILKVHDMFCLQTQANLCRFWKSNSLMVFFTIDP